MITRMNSTTLCNEIAARLAAHLGHDALPLFAPPPPEPTDAECRALVNQYRDELAAQIGARLEAEAVAAGTNRFWFQAAAQRDDLREVVAHQRESIISLRRQLTTAVAVADAANRDAAGAVRAMETAGAACAALLERAHTLALRLGDAGLYGLPEDLAGGANPAVFQQARAIIDGGGAAKDCNGDAQL